MGPWCTPFCEQVPRLFWQGFRSDKVMQGAGTSFSWVTKPTSTPPIVSVETDAILDLNNTTKNIMDGLKSRLEKVD